MYTHRKLMMVCCASVLALGLAACGGGGSSTPPQTTTPPTTTPEPAASTEQEKFDARIARSNAENAKDTAVTAVADAVTTAETAAGKALNYAGNASGSASTAMAARTDYASASTASTNAGTQSTAAGNAKTAADAAQTALTNAITTYETAVDGQDINTQDGAKAIEEAANTLKTAVEKAQEDAEMAQEDAETARDMAMGFATEAETAAGAHVLSLFLAANGAHVPDLESTTTINEKAMHVTSVGAAMAAIAGAAGGNQAASTTGTAIWPGDTVEDPDTAGDQFVAGMFSFTVNVAGTNSITSELRPSRVATDLNSDGDTDDASEARIIQTAKAIDDLGTFQGYDLWEDDGDATTDTDRARAIVFTNKKQGDDSKLTRVGGAARSVIGEAVSTAAELSNVRSSGRTITGVTWTPSGEPPLMGTLSCAADAACDITLGAGGAVTTIEGYTFTGSRAAVEAVTAADAAEDNDYLVFGLWLEESDDGATDTFGAFANGGTDYAVGAQAAVTGTADYSGKAAGAHHKTGEGVNWFEGNAGLTANFGTATADGTISGSISGIRVNGGPEMSTPIYLGQAALTDGTATFNGAAFMGAATAPGAVTHEFDGTWSGSFFGETVNDAGTTAVDESVTAPLAAAGTFGVTKSEGTGNDMVIESFVGAFGAHKQ